MSFSAVEEIMDRAGETMDRLQHRIVELEELRYEWAGIINRLATIAMAEEVSTNDRDYAQDAIDMAIPYLGLAEE